MGTGQENTSVGGNGRYRNESTTSQLGMGITTIPKVINSHTAVRQCHRNQRPVLRILYLNKTLIGRWDSERELTLRRHRTRTTKYNRVVRKCRKWSSATTESTWYCHLVSTHQHLWRGVHVDCVKCPCSVLSLEPVHLVVVVVVYKASSSSTDGSRTQR